MWMRLFLLCCCSLPLSISADTLRLGGMVRCPYICVPDEPQPGFILEIAREVMGQAGHRVEFEALPWSRALKYVRSGMLDGIAGVLRRNAPDLIYPQRAQGFSQYVFFVPQASKWRHTGLLSLWQVRIGVTQDISYGSMDSYINRYRDSIRIQSLAGEAAVSQNLLALERGRIDVLLEDRAVMAYYLRQSPQEAVLKEAGELHGENLYIAFFRDHPKGPEYSQLLSDGIEKLRASGELERILEGYGVRDWDEP